MTPATEQIEMLRAHCPALIRFEEIGAICTADRHANVLVISYMEPWQTRIVMAGRLGAGNAAIMRPSHNRLEHASGARVSFAQADNLSALHGQSPTHLCEIHTLADAPEPAPLAPGADRADVGGWQLTLEVSGSTVFELQERLLNVMSALHGLHDERRPIDLTRAEVEELGGMLQAVPR